MWDPTNTELGALTCGWTSWTQRTGEERGRRGCVTLRRMCGSVSVLVESSMPRPASSYDHTVRLTFLSFCHWAQFLCCQQNTPEIPASAATHQSASASIRHTCTYRQTISPFMTTVQGGFFLITHLFELYQGLIGHDRQVDHEFDTSIQTCYSHGPFVKKPHFLQLEKMYHSASPNNHQCTSLKKPK